jgi:hypothetical protein
MVRERANLRCEYCLIPHYALPLPFQIDHIIAEQHGGQSDGSNLSLACAHCNRHKGPNIAGIDPFTGEMVRLFNPRIDSWPDHFQREGATAVGKTPVGRATIEVLAMNSGDQISLRAELLLNGELYGAR